MHVAVIYRNLTIDNSIMINKQHNKIFGATGPYIPKPTIESHPELAREIINRIVKAEDLARTTAAEWSIETIKHIALFCATGMAGSFAAMQVPKISSPLFHSISGLLFFFAFALCIYRMHCTVLLLETAARNSKQQFENALWGKSKTLEDLCTRSEQDIALDKKWPMVYLMGWIASGLAVTGTALLLIPIVWLQFQQ